MIHNTTQKERNVKVPQKWEAPGCKSVLGYKSSHLRWRRRKKGGGERFRVKLLIRYILSTGREERLKGKKARERGTLHV